MKAITKEELHNLIELIKKDCVLINVLPAEAFNKAHIKHSINIPLEKEDFVDLVHLVAGHKQRNVVVYCSGFSCAVSEKAAQRLEEAGFHNVYDYAGGLKDWFGNEQAA